ncbi:MULTISPECIES: DUF3703 domain-containing protein [Rhodococcus]|uniref:DUF3703 domain-containing protein n=2 Tax=Rhodococcus erythropolis group TaxID=2840174 RepID=Q6XN56_RHOER|nr:MULTISPECIES: DUF3703 domain-containing protein [Rhodococcus]AAP73975.1 hypothetical protein PBD2.090 [Rhodococcus erythropolis]AZI65739.1 DUF3703 domain-containing protein [Rhodococcus sp. NJ-530]MCJ0901117.1 DUF3703 domain-containing protein [Rhodococcus sp. ARC_M13]MDV8128753.1 DUF3703 domain-containing protein [Rhodococcus sp. IEGM 1304]OFE09245.1 hypothetical protein A5N83_08580 [Rhodococcus sp. 1139]
MSTPTTAVRALYEREMSSAHTASDDTVRWSHLERPHILSQPHPWLHTRNHLSMLNLALRQHDRREALGQVLRIVVAAPGSLSGRYPVSNTGRTAVGLMTPMPIPADIQKLLARSNTEDSDAATEPESTHG